MLELAYVILWAYLCIPKRGKRVAKERPDGSITACVWV